MPIEPKNRDKRNFDDLQLERLGNYVYALRDPRDNKIFYIGQASCNNRLFDHFAEAESYLNGGIKEPAPKILRIVEIWSEDEDVDWFILAHGLDDKASALNAVESAAIDLLSYSQNGAALNRVAGPHSSLLTQEMLSDLGAAPVNPGVPLHMVFVFPIQARLAEGADPYEASRRAWHVAERFRNNQGAIAVGLSNYISRGVFEIDHWRDFYDRHEFEGQDANLPELLNKNWHSVISRSMGYWQRGNYLIVEFNGQGQFRYVRGNPDKITWYDL